MSSPGARQRRRRQQYQSPRTRREITIAASAGFVIVAATALLIWMLRPGGIADRQPRSSWLIGLALIAAATASYVILRPSSRLRFDKTLSLATSLGAILVVAVVAGFAWPHGLVRHTPKAVQFTTTPTSPTTQPPAPGITTAPAGSTTTRPGSTTAPGATTAPTTTTAPGATTAPTAAPGATASTTVP